MTTEKDVLLAIKYHFGTDKKIGLLSVEDVDLAQLPWGKSNGYAMGCQNNGYMGKMLHRIIIERVVGRPLTRIEFIDHINGNRSDNRRDNLRLANSSLNQANSKLSTRNKFGYKGVCLDISAARKGKPSIYRTTVRVKGKAIISVHRTTEEAAKAYDKLALQYFGEFARLNFPEK